MHGYKDTVDVNVGAICAVLNRNNKEFCRVRIESIASSGMVRSMLYTPRVIILTLKPRVVKSSQLPAKIPAYLVSIGQLLCLAFLYGWLFLNKIFMDWLLTLTIQPSTSKLSDNPETPVSTCKFS